MSALSMIYSHTHHYAGITDIYIYSMIFSRALHCAGSTALCTRALDTLDGNKRGMTDSWEERTAGRNCELCMY